MPRMNAIAPANAEELSPAESLLMQHLSAESRHVDELANTSGLAIRQVTSTLTILELKGLVRQTGAMQYALAEPSRNYKPKS